MNSLLTLTLLVLAAPERKPLAPAEEPPPSIQQQVLGEWKLVSAIIGGNNEVANRPKETILIFTPKLIQVREDGNQRPNDDANYMLDAAKGPATIDIMPKGAKILGILKVEGDQLTLCFSLGLERPASFTPPAGSQVSLFRFQRVKR
ncbi:MAG: TIGR03067 domain-containing protein [Planctomycetes bacterium]|nr:TIGR03067 domain-containing protein [Planctomycetota bacterium]